MKDSYSRSIESLIFLSLTMLAVCDAADTFRIRDLQDRVTKLEAAAKPSDRILVPVNQNDSGK